MLVGKPGECTPRHLSLPLAGYLCPALVSSIHEPLAHRILPVVLSNMSGAPRHQLFLTSKSACWASEAFGKGLQAGPADGNYRSTQSHLELTGLNQFNKGECLFTLFKTPGINTLVRFISVHTPDSRMMEAATDLGHWGPCLSLILTRHPSQTWTQQGLLLHLPLSYLY